MAHPPIRFKGKLGRIVVACDECGVAYDVRDILKETTHPGALYVARFDCPKNHRCEARRVWTLMSDDSLPGISSAASSPAQTE